MNRENALALLVDDGTLVKIRCQGCGVREFYASPEMTDRRDEWLCSRCAVSPRAERIGSVSDGGGCCCGEC
jgi:hypothetical protein